MEKGNLETLIQMIKEDYLKYLYKSIYLKKTIEDYELTESNYENSYDYGVLQSQHNEAEVNYVSLDSYLSKLNVDKKDYQIKLKD